MATADFGPFFAATAAVAGALIGLLFVALSVAPERTDRNERIVDDVRAGIAFSCLVNPLAVSLFALIPGMDIGQTAGAVGVVSFASCCALALVLLREAAPGRLRRQQLWRLAIQALVFAYAAFVGFELAHRAKDEGLERTVCVLIVVLFLIGIARAWQLIGARDASLVGEVARTIGSRRRPTDPDD
jgi:small-conductance mechanosensitive channel